MKRRLAAYVLIGAVLFPVLLAVTAPATWVAWGLHRASEGRLRLDSTDGYFWSGEGILVVSPAHERPLALGRVGWQLDPWPLFRGHLHVRLHGGDGPTHLEGVFELASGELVVRDALIRFPAELVAALYPPALLFGPGGAVAVTSPVMEWRRDRLDGQANVRWDRAATRLSSVRPLGDYRLYLDGQGGRVVLWVETVSGALVVEGQGEWRLDTGKARFDGSAYAAAHSSELDPMLRLIGRDQGDGRRRFVLTGWIEGFAPRP